MEKAGAQKDFRKLAQFACASPGWPVFPACLRFEFYKTIIKAMMLANSRSHWTSM